MKETIDIRELYKMKQNELYAYILQCVTRYSKDAFDVTVDSNAENPMYIALMPRKSNKYFPVLVSHLDTMMRVSDRSVLYDTVPDAIVESFGYYRGFKKCKPFILGADDRNGVWAMLKLILGGYHQWGYIFVKDEEKGRLGAKALVKSKFFKNHPKAKHICYFIDIDMPGIDYLGSHALLEDLVGFTNDNETP